MVLVKISLQNIFGMMKYGWSNEWMGWRVKCKDVRVSRERYKGTKKSCMIEKYRRVEKRYLCWGGHGGCSWASPDDRGVPANLVLPEVLRRPKMTSWLNFMFFLSSLEILVGYRSHLFQPYFFKNFNHKQKFLQTWGPIGPKSPFSPGQPLGPYKATLQFEEDDSS